MKMYQVKVLPEAELRKLLEEQGFSLDSEDGEHETKMNPIEEKYWVTRSFWEEMFEQCDEEMIVKTMPKQYKDQFTSMKPHNLQGYLWHKTWFVADSFVELP